MATETPRARFERLKAEVLTLTKQQKASIVKLLSDSGESEMKEEGSGLERRVYSIIDLVLKDLTGTGAPPMPVMMKRMGPTLHRALTAVVVFVNRLDTEPRLTQAEKEATYLFLVRLVVDRMQSDKELPLTFTTCVQQLEQVGLYVNEAYPGYIKSGAFRVVLKAANVIS